MVARNATEMDHGRVSLQHSQRKSIEHIARQRSKVKSDQSQAKSDRRAPGPNLDLSIPTLRVVVNAVHNSPTALEEL